MPFGLFNYGFKRTPFAIAVPLAGTDSVMGLRQLERLAHRRPSMRTRYRRFQGPFLEYLTLEDMTRTPRDWRQFWNCDPKNMRLSSYSIPGSADALSERIEENLAYFVPNYLRLMLFILLIMLGFVNAIIAVLLLGVYSYTHERLNNLQHSQQEGGKQKPDSTESVEGSAIWRQLHKLIVEFVFPVTLFWLLVLTPAAIRVARGLLSSMGAVLLHAGLHRSPSEYKQRRQHGVVRWILRDKDSPEGLFLLSKDVWHRLREWLSELHYQWQWKMLAIRDQIAYHWTLRRAR